MLISHYRHVHEPGNAELKILCGIDDYYSKCTSVRAVIAHIKLKHHDFHARHIASDRARPPSTVLDENNDEVMHSPESSTSELIKPEIDLESRVAVLL